MNGLQIFTSELAGDLDRADKQLVAAVEDACEALCAFDADIVHSREAIAALHDGVCAAIDAALDEFHYQIADAKRRAARGLQP
jgi:hypothetical protein